MLKWDKLLFKSSILTEQSWKSICSNSIKMNRFPIWVQSSFRNRVTSDFQYGYGWVMANYQEKRLLTHGGNTLGFTAEYLKILGNNEISIIVLCNTNRRNIKILTEKLLDVAEILS
jgi:CubicO group peptidase (beta-lactamase class C family)